MTQDFTTRYIAARQAVIARRYARMNPSQRQAVLALSLIHISEPTRPY